jgi:hypothetical protein
MKKGTSIGILIFGSTAILALTLALGSSPTYCDYRVIEIQIFYGSGSKAKSSVLKRQAFVTRDTLTLRKITEANWSSNGTWAKMKDFKFAIVSVPDTQYCNPDDPDTTYFDSRCYIFERGEGTAEVSAKFLLMVSRLVSEEDGSKMFSSAPCQAKLKYALEEEAHPQSSN